jgi:hypothetical protein
MVRHTTALVAGTLPRPGLRFGPCVGIVRGAWQRQEEPCPLPANGRTPWRKMEIILFTGIELPLGTSESFV